VTLTYGPRPTSATTNGTFWNDANGDQIAQANEIGCTLAPGCLPTASTSRWNPATGQLDTSPNAIDPNLKNQRTREFVTGFEHELFSNVGVGADYIWRKYDQNNNSFFNNTPYPPSQIYVGPFNFTDPVSGLSSTYWQVCPTCLQPAGPTTTLNSPDYVDYNGVEITAEKRMSHRWRASTSVTLSRARQFNPPGAYTDPTNQDKQNGYDGGNSNIRWVYKLQGQVILPLAINMAGALNMQDGFLRTITITGPSGRNGGFSPTGAATTLGPPTLEIYTRGTNRYDSFSELDLGFSRVFAFNGGKNRLTGMVDIFNTLNINTIRAQNSNKSQTNFDTVTAVVPPRAIRLGVRVNF